MIRHQWAHLDLLSASILINVGMWEILPPKWLLWLLLAYNIYRLFALHCEEKAEQRGAA